ncbi:hypothetical protein FIBSPDRAFT_867623 [Athelia psychrophila]|uniref:Uncharacterized protein n=1 Tax=Athelia psychrophila TaxID=1759441 RepID=A0A166DX73_9AGAM|nr:hypothetical protein FIBSPDRAFT_867623 [Fibularhizoctonia sp. CBS 109695]
MPLPQRRTLALFQSCALPGAGHVPRQHQKRRRLVAPGDNTPPPDIHGDKLFMVKVQEMVNSGPPNVYTEELSGVYAGKWRARGVQRGDESDESASPQGSKDVSVGEASG